MVAQIKVMAGLIHDRPFGPMVMFGLGGILVRLLNAMASRMVLLYPGDARAMIRNVRSFRTS
jgi:acyl-CoA synthetase (NDP forming)